jgi:WD40 repeat protein
MSLSFSPDGKTLAAACYHGFLELWNVDSGRLQRTIGYYHRMSRVVFAPDGHTIAAAVDYNAVDPDYPHGPDTPQGPGEVVKLWDASTGRLLRTLTDSSPKPGSTDMITTLAYSPDGRSLACGSQFAFRIWDSATGKRPRMLRSYKNYKHMANSAAFAPGGRLLALAKSDRSVELWDTLTWRVKRTLRFAGDVSVAISPDSKTLATTCNGRLSLREL